MLHTTAEPRPAQSVKFELAVRPIPQARHRHRRGGGTYDPCAAQKDEFLREALRACAPPPPDVRALPFRCVLHFRFARPKSHVLKSGRLRKGARVMHTGKPDVDNLSKYVLDALNGAFYVDDSQCVQLNVTKEYADADAVGVDLLFVNAAL